MYQCVSILKKLGVIFYKYDWADPDQSFFSDPAKKFGSGSKLKVVLWSDAI